MGLHPTKKIANIILPFSTSEDGKHVCNFLKILSKNDERIKKSFENKKLGGYISINKENKDDCNIDTDDAIIKYNEIYNSMGVAINGDDIWKYKFEKLKNYMDKNNKRPSNSVKSDDEEQQFANWVSTQLKNRNNKEYNMKNEDIYNIWDDFVNGEKYGKIHLTLLKNILTQIIRNLFVVITKIIV